MADTKTKTTKEVETMSFNDRVIALQNELKAPKSRFNSFANYAYRSCEDILEAVKPLTAKWGLLLNISDEIVQVGERYYVKATAKLIDAIGKEGYYIQSHAYAREGDPKKGLESSQQSGLTSSYSRKYCLSALLLLDDTKDADTDEYQKQTGKRNFLAEISKINDITDLEIWWNNNLEELKKQDNYGEIRRIAGERSKQIQR